MDTRRKFLKIGNTKGPAFSEAPLAQLRVERGNANCATENTDSVRSTAVNVEFESKMAAVGEIMREDWEVLDSLAR